MPTATGSSSGPTTEEAGEDIVVTGFRRSLAEGLELKREAVGVRDSIVAEDIGKFPEANVADSLQRIPGVILSRDGASNEGQRISIRGLGSDFTVTTINMAPVRTTSSLDAGGSSRNFNYDVFPSELFGRVDVYKTPLANLEEGGIGGNVDLQTPRPFDSKGRVIRYTAQANYNTQSKQWGPRGSLLLSDTVGNFGALLGVAYSRTVNERSGFQSTGGYNSSVIGSGGYRTPAGQTRPPVGPFEFQLDTNNPRANLGGLTAAQVNNGLLPRFYRVFASDNDRERLGLVGSLQYKSDRLDVSVDGIYSHLKDIGNEYTWGVAVRNSRTTATTTDLPGRGTNSGIIPLGVQLDEYNNLYGTFGNTNIVTESLYRTSETKFRYGIVRAAYDVTNRLKVSAQGNLSDSRAYKEGNRIASNIYGATTTFDPTGNVTYPTITSTTDPTNPRNYTVPTLGFTRDDEIDKQRTARALADWRLVDEDDRLFTLRLGGSYVSTVKEIQRRDGSNIAASRALPGGGTFRTIDVFANMNSTIPIGPLRNGGNSGFPSQFATFPRSFVEGTLDAHGSNIAAPIQLNGAFRAEEQVSTGFFEVDFKMPLLGSELRGNAGLRYSDTKTVVDNFVANGRGGFDPANRRGGYDNWLPSASLAFDVRQNITLRASAGQTITRNALSTIAGSTLIPNPFNADVTVGNPDLRPQLASQYDAVAEWYFAPGALLSVGVFKKDITDQPFAVQDFVSFGSLGVPASVFNAISLGFPNGVIPADFQIRRTIIINQNQLKLKGLEVAYQQNFTFLPKPFDGLGVTSSFTLIDQQGADFVSLASGKRTSIQTVPDYSYSITGFYEKGPLSIRGSYNYRAKTGQSNVNTGNDQIPYTAPQGFLDGTVSFRLNDYVEFRVDALNLTNTNVYTYYDNPDQPSGNGKSRRDNSFFNGTTISFGVRGKF
ncbi:TonB-dependent receptor-like protein [Sphingomonas sp. Leaf339]|nr:TonB-dependent receptor-like protein [Sphingomonas sp. Leaf339]